MLYKDDTALRAVATACMAFAGPIKRRRDALTRPLVIDRSGTMPRPPPEFDFASDSDFLTGMRRPRWRAVMLLSDKLNVGCEFQVFASF